jgi:tetratricopeptide (TPR) repeat protein
MDFLKKLLNRGEVEPLLPDATAYYNRGNANSRQGHYDLAINNYTKAIELDPNYIDAYLNRGNAYFEKGRIRLAIADFDQAIELSPRYASAYNNRGMAYYSQGVKNQAIADIKKALELGLDPGNKQKAEEVLDWLQQ